MNATQFFQFGHQNQPKRMVQKVVVRIEGGAEIIPFSSILNEGLYMPYISFSKRMGNRELQAQSVSEFSIMNSEMRAKYKPILRVENTDLLFEMFIPLTKNTGAETFEVTNFQLSLNTQKENVDTSSRYFVMKYNAEYLFRKSSSFCQEDIKNTDFYHYSISTSAQPHLVLADGAPMIYDNEKDIEIVLTKI